MDKLVNLDRRIIYFVMLVLVSLPLLSPLGIPLLITQGTRDMYEQLDAVPAGSRVLFSINYDPTSAPDIAPQAVVMLDHLMSNNVNVALVCFSAAGPNLIEGLMAPHLAAGKMCIRDRLRGVDLVVSDQHGGLVKAVETQFQRMGVITAR